MSVELDRIHAIFAYERGLFARVFSWVADSTLTISLRICSPASRCAWRDFAWAYPDRGQVFMSYRTLSLPVDNQIGLILHELGHLSDERVTEPWKEQRADDLAEFATGKRIHYDHRDLQTIGPGQYPRPLHLKRSPMR